MGSKSCTDEEFIRLFKNLGANETARTLGIAVRSVYGRRQSIETRHDIPLPNPNSRNSERRFCGKYPMRLPIEIADGVALFGSDAHYCPGIRSTAHRALVHLSKELGPKLVCLNGDVKDGATNGRHKPLGWESKPSVAEEIEVVDERITEIRDSSKKAIHLWTLGNHDMRFDARLADAAPEYKGVKGFSLSDHFRGWTFALSAWVNDDLVVKHRFKGGVHATHNNTLMAGKSMLTGHLHSLKVTPFDDYNGTRFGIDSGTMADPYGEHADYGEDNPLNHRSGLIVLTFHKSRLLWPEIVHVVDENTVQFRGKLIRV